MNKEQISAEFDDFFEFPTSDKSQVSSVSCKLFSMIMVEMALSQSEPKCSCDGSGLVHTSDGTFLGHCDEHSAYRSEPANKKWEPSQALKDALAQSQKDGTLAFMCEGEPVFVSREGPPELHEYPECPTCHGSGCAGDNELVDSLELLYCQLTGSDSANGLASSDDFKAWKEKHLLAKNKSDPVQEESENIAHSLAGFKGGFIALHRRQPTEQDIWNHAIKSWRDLNPISSPDYKALRTENTLLKEVEKSFADLSENLQKDCAALKLRLAELEESNINRHYMSRIEKLRDSYEKAAKLVADQHLVVIDLTSERDRLQSDKANLIQQAEIQAQEARTMKSIVIGILTDLDLPQKDYEARSSIAQKFSRLQSECEILNVRLALAMMPESERLAKLQGAE